MNYDNWKLSNPIDDGSTYDMVSSCCGAEIVEGTISNCCGAKMYEETDICSECKEHADVEEYCCSECGYECEEIEDYEYEAIQAENAAEMARDGEKDENW
jgi:predicted amidophosphoribosyltransferase